MKHELSIPVPGCVVRGELRMAERPAGIVVLVHGSGIDRHDSLHRYLAASLVRAGFGALLVDLLAEREAHERHDVFDVEMQAERLVAVKEWLRSQPATQALDIGYFGTGVGAGVVAMAAAQSPQGVGALVVRGGRPDTALHLLGRVETPTLFFAAGSGADQRWVEAAHRAAGGVKELVFIPSATDSFREAGVMESVTQHACRWFSRYLTLGTLQADLKQHHPGIECRVTVEERPPRAYERRRFNVRLDVSFDSRCFVVNREHDEDAAVALREAFQVANRQLDNLELAGHRG